MLIHELERKSPATSSKTVKDGRGVGYKTTTNDDNHKENRTSEVEHKIPGTIYSYNLDRNLILNGVGFLPH